MLDLKPHPEGGYYREVFRSAKAVKTEDQRAERSVLTAIYFLLQTGQHSCWHRVSSDEIWCHLEGAPLELHCFEAQGARLTSTRLGGCTTPGTAPMHVVPAGVWQAAEPNGEYALLGCFVAPGFDFKDFQLATDDPGMTQILREQGAGVARLLRE